MNTAMKLLMMIGVKMEKADDGSQGDTSGSPSVTSDFKPNQVVKQGTNIFSERTEAEENDEENLDSDADIASAFTGDKDTNEGGESDGNEDTDGNEGDEDTDKDEVDTEEVEGDTFIYNGVSVEIENDPQIAAQLKEKGFDINEINKEFYSEKGISADTQIKLYDAFGRASVDMYLSGLRRANDAALATQEAKDATHAARFGQIANQAADGDWNALAKWANDNLAPADYKKYQAIINSDSPEAVQMGIENLNALRKAQSAEQTPDANNPRKRAIDTSNTETVQAGTLGLSSDEYMKLFVPSEKYPQGEYYEDPQKFDKLRNLGKAQGR